MSYKYKVSYVNTSDHTQAEVTLNTWANEGWRVIAINPIGGLSEMSYVVLEMPVDVITSPLSDEECATLADHFARISNDMTAATIAAGRGGMQSLGRKRRISHAQGETPTYKEEGDGS